MASPSYTQDLIDKLRSLPDDKLAEVVDFVDFLRARLTQGGSTLEERLRVAEDAGLLAAPAAGRARSSVQDVPPVNVPGKPASEMVIEDRR